MNLSTLSLALAQSCLGTGHAAETPRAGGPVTPQVHQPALQRPSADAAFSTHPPADVGSPVTWTPATWGTGPSVDMRGGRADFLIQATSDNGAFGAALTTLCTLIGNFDYEVA